MSKSADEPLNGDVLIVAHGHILRAFAMRWIGKPLTDTAFILEAGGVGTLRYISCLLMKCEAWVDREKNRKLSFSFLLAGIADTINRLS